MNKMKELMKLAGGFINKNDTKLLTGFAVAGVVATFGLAMKAGAKVSEVSKKKKLELEITDPDDKATKKKVIMEGVKEAAPSVAAAAVMGAATIGAIVGSHEKSTRKIATITAAYTLADGKVKDLTKAMNEVLDPKKVQEVKDKIVKDKVNDTPINQSNIVITGDGSVPCKDSFTGRLFYTNGAKLQRSIGELSDMCRNEYWVCLNELYDLVGLEECPMGDEFGWNTDDLVGGVLPITINAQLTDDNVPILYLDYYSKLKHDYRNLH